MDFFKNLSMHGCITILPHDSIDVDAAVSAILFSKLLDFYNVPNEIAIFDESIDKWTKHFLNKLGYDLSKFLVKKEDKSRKIFLVDHYKTSHKGTVVGCIDHHLTSESNNYSYYLYRASCSAAYVIYDLMKRLHIPITKEIVALVGYASLVDTCSFKSTKSVEKEKSEIISLLKDYDFNVEEMLYECLCIDDIFQMSLEEIALNGVKTYHYGKSIVKSSYVQVGSLDISKEVLYFISKLVSTEKLDMWVFIVFDMINEKTIVCKITKNRICIETIDKILSRGKDIMPKIEEEFCN